MLKNRTAWEAAVLPLNYARGINGLAPVAARNVLQFVLHRSDPNLLNIRQKKSPRQSRARRWSDRQLRLPGDAGLTVAGRG